MFDKDEIEELNRRFPPEMTDDQFKELRQEIIDAINRLNYLQRIHYREEGKSYKPFI